jgi:UDP:flavonoid glycosyltransferase YjiC (YdhE family)
VVKVLLTPFGSHGDVHPFLALGTELVRRGHEVQVITNGHFRGLVEQAGLGFAEAGTAEYYREVIDNPDVWHPRRGAALFFAYLVGPLLRRVYEVLAERYEPGRTVLVSPPQALAARLAQEKLGAPLVTVHIAPASLRSSVAPPVLPGVFLPQWAPRWAHRFVFWVGDRFIVDPVVNGPLNAFRAELGLPPVRRIMKGWWNSPQRIVGLFPAWFAPPPPDWPAQLRLTGFPLFDERRLRAPPAELEAFLAAGTPPLVFTPGSAMLYGQAFFEAALEACRRLGRRGLLLTGHAGHLPPSLPESVRHFDYVPFSQVFPRAAAVVHHGGIGTTAQGLAAGVPQMVMPMNFDQADNAARVIRLGVGDALGPRRFTDARLARRLEKLLRPEVRGRCQEVVTRFRGTDAVGQACDLIEGLCGATSLSR